jgi:predicted protein tyrosine phosphatase
MLYAIMNRDKARVAALHSEAPATAIISIIDPDRESNDFRPQPWLKEVLELKFKDVEAGIAQCITKRQARKIADFAKRHYGQVERFIVHCEYGISRSAGVAAALSEYFEGHDNGIFTNRAYSPNMTCYDYVLAALQKDAKPKNRFFSKFFRKFIF